MLTMPSNVNALLGPLPPEDPGSLEFSIPGRRESYLSLPGGRIFPPQNVAGMWLKCGATP
jgi:hypothetical protein